MWYVTREMAKLRNAAGIRNVRAPAHGRMRLKYVESLLDGYGEITIGRVGPIRCAAIACDEDQQLAMLVRRAGESLEDLLRRLEAALVRACEHDEYIDEINAPVQPNQRLERTGRRTPRRGRAPRAAGRSTAGR
jgi:hypothetical protein